MAPRLPTARTSASGDVREMLGPARGLIGPASIDAVILSYRNQLGFKGGQSVLMVLKSNTLPVKFQSIQGSYFCITLEALKKIENINADLI
ncbi:hypothetical protein PSTT_02578 [Puccinia striiformis]|uniref:Uncharacterized protein n=2 Tax=Puccinia striiformis TaxID=27350 RepID=A0A2S4VZN4_9BASI